MLNVLPFGDSGLFVVLQEANCFASLAQTMRSQMHQSIDRVIISLNRFSVLHTVREQVAHAKFINANSQGKSAEGNGKKTKLSHFISISIVINNPSNGFKHKNGDSKEKN